MKLSAYAKLQGVAYKTAWRWFKDGRLPVGSYQAPSGTIIVNIDAPSVNGLTGGVAVYARVSSHDQKNDLDAQVGRLTAWAIQNGYPVTRVVKEIASGLNGRRRQLKDLLADTSVSVIIVEHRDRFMRFGSEYVEAMLRSQGRRLLVVDTGELDDDLVHDMVDLLTSFCARLYGRRSAANRAKRAMEAARG